MLDFFLEISEKRNTGKVLLRRSNTFVSKELLHFPHPNTKQSRQHLSVELVFYILCRVVLILKEVNLGMHGGSPPSDLTWEKRGGVFNPRTIVRIYLNKHHVRLKRNALQRTHTFFEVDWRALSTLSCVQTYMQTSSSPPSILLFRLLNPPLLPARSASPPSTRSFISSTDGQTDLSCPCFFYLGSAVDSFSDSSKEVTRPTSSG